MHISHYSVFRAHTIHHSAGITFKTTRGLGLVSDGGILVNFSHEAIEESHEKMCRIDEFESQTVWNVKPTRLERKLLALEHLNFFGKKDFGSFPLIPSPCPPLPPSAAD